VAESARVSASPHIWSVALMPLMSRSLPPRVKVIVWDIVLGLGTTDAIGGDVGVWAGTIVTTYVGGPLAREDRRHDLEAEMTREEIAIVVREVMRDERATLVNTQDTGILQAISTILTSFCI
jgi:hypothetical protein